MDSTADLSTDLLVEVFQHEDGTSVLTRLALVCSSWCRAAAELELWRRLIARRFERLHEMDEGEVDAADIAAPEAACYDLQDVYFRLARHPRWVVKESNAIKLQPAPRQPGNSFLGRPHEARFVGELLGGNQTVRANVAWPSTVAGKVYASHTAGAVAVTPVADLLANTSSGRAEMSGPWPALRPVLQPCHYFEVCILPPRDDIDGARASGAWYGRPCVAVGVCTAQFRLMHKMPGWDRFSVAYHGDDGCKFQNSTFGETYGPPFGEGDVVGCGLWLPAPGAPDEAAGRLFFTLNGSLLPDPGLDLTATHLNACALFPCVGIDSYNPVRINMGQEPFKFDPFTAVGYARYAKQGPPKSMLLKSADIKAELRGSLRPAPGIQPPPGDDDDASVDSPLQQIRHLLELDIGHLAELIAHGLPVDIAMRNDDGGSVDGEDDDEDDLDSLAGDTGDEAEEEELGEEEQEGAQSLDEGEEPLENEWLVDAGDRS